MDALAGSFFCEMFKNFPRKWGKFLNGMEYTWEYTIRQRVKSVETKLARYKEKLRKKGVK